MRIKIEYIEVQMLIAGLDAMHLPTIMHDEVKKKLKRRLERMESDSVSYTHLTLPTIYSV